MRSLILAAAAFLAVAAPGVASAQTGGTIGFLYADLDEEGDADKESAIGIDGVILTDTAAGWTIGIRGETYDMDHNTHSDAFSQVEGSASYAISDMIRLGAHLGHFNNNGSSYWTYGVAARADINQFYVAASATSANLSNGSGDDPSNISVSAGMAVTDNIGVAVTGSWTDVGSTDVDSWTIAAGYGFVGTGFEVGAFYRTSDFDVGDTDAIGIRLAYNFGDDMRRAHMMGSEELMYDAIAIQ